MTPPPLPFDSFDFDCADCGRTIKVRDGRQRWHLCLCPPWLRGRAARAAAESMIWTCEQAGHPKQQPDDTWCICETWAYHVDEGAIEINC